MSASGACSGYAREQVSGLALAVLRCGSGSPVLVLHGTETFAADAPFLERLTEGAEVIAPCHPGFGESPRPDWFRTVYDLARLYLGLLDVSKGEPATLVGLSFGGWIAAEMAVACCHRIARLVLVDALGIRVSDRETADILHLFNAAPAEVRRRSWHDPRKAPDYDAMTDAELVTRARNRDALCLYGWDPYMHDPRLRHWLHRITVPTLVLWGESDGVVTPAYGRAYAQLIPGARFELMSGAGHHPEMEQPHALAERIAAFMRE